MFTTLALVSVLACKPYSPPVSVSAPPVFTTCEGADLVTRNHDRLEVRRMPNACTPVVRCEGADRVRRNRFGVELSRETNACTVARCEGNDRVVRTSGGGEVSRWSNACFREPPPPQREVLSFGLSYR